MLEFATRIRVQVLDVIPGIVLTRVTDALRARGLEVEVRGDDWGHSSGAADSPIDGAIDVANVWSALPQRDDVTWLFLTARPLRRRDEHDEHDGKEQFAAFEHRAAIVSCLAEDRDSGLANSTARGVANAVIDGPLAALCGDLPATTSPRAK